MFRNIFEFSKFLKPACLNSRIKISKCFFSVNLDQKYSEEQKTKILQIINDSNLDLLANYEITKVRMKKFSQWKSNNGHAKTLLDIEQIEGFTEKTAKKLFDSILDGPQKKVNSKIKGQILYPNLTASVIKDCKSILTIYTAVNSISWALISKDNYEVLEWIYTPIEYPDGKRFQITDILNIAWRIARSLPTADIYVMKAEATTLRAAGSDPSNPKVIGVNLQKAQMVAMIVALLNARSSAKMAADDGSDQENLQQRVFFLRPSLPFRLYGTLVGNEKVATDQTVEILLQHVKHSPKDPSQVQMSDELMDMYRSQKDLQKDMLGHCLLLSLTFMDLCIYKNQDRIAKLLKAGE